jgi:hypothetical protein
MIPVSPHVLDIICLITVWSKGDFSASAHALGVINFFLRHGQKVGDSNAFTFVKLDIQKSIYGKVNR